MDVHFDKGFLLLGRQLGMEIFGTFLDWKSAIFLFCNYSCVLMGFCRIFNDYIYGRITGCAYEPKRGCSHRRSFFLANIPKNYPSPYQSRCDYLSLNAGFQVFDVIYTLTGGGPGRATQSVAVNIYEEAFRGNIRYGYATAKSTILFIIVLIITALQLNITGKRDVEI